MFGNLLKSFMTQVVIIKAHNIPKKLYFGNEYHALVELSDKNMNKNYSDNRSRDGWTENNKDKKPRALTTRTIFLSGQQGIYHQV